MSQPLRPGKQAVELLRQLKRTADHLLPFYAEDTVGAVVDEINALLTATSSTIDTFCKDAETGQISEELLQDPRIATCLLCHVETMHRNVRCVLAYLHHRIERLKMYRWELGGVLPLHAQNSCSANEKAFFAGYSRLLGEYQDSCNLDLTVNMIPPKERDITVRVLEDVGEMELPNGSVVNLTKGSQHLLPREFIEELVRQGKLEHIA